MPRDARARAIDTVEFSADEEADTYYDVYTGHSREGGGYTPFEFISFSDEVLRHEVVQRVEAPVSKCFKIWSDRFNWMQWFDMIEEVRRCSSSSSSSPLRLRAGLLFGWVCTCRRPAGSRVCRLVVLHSRASGRWRHLQGDVGPGAGAVALSASCAGAALHAALCHALTASLPLAGFLAAGQGRGESGLEPLGGRLPCRLGGWLWRGP
jgi:hypothetical protein